MGNQAKEAHLGAQAKRQQGKKSKKDPDMPKRYLTAFMLFAQANRQRVKASFAHAATTPEVSTRLGKAWRAMSEEEKQPYVVQSAQALEEHNQAKEAHLGAQA